MRPSRLILIALLSALAVVAWPNLVAAATFTVDSTADAVDANPGDDLCATAGGACTLRAAVQEANNPQESPDVILLPAGTYVLSIPGGFEDDSATGDLDVRDQLEIIGAGADTTIIDANALDRVIHVLSGGSLAIDGVTVRNGLIGIETYGPLVVSHCVVRDNAGGDVSAGIDIENGAPALVTDSTVTDNASVSCCAGIRNYYASTLMLVRSTVSDNSTTGQGGGISSYGDSTLVLESSTVSGNTAGLGGGLSFFGEEATISNSTISGNSATTAGGGIFRYPSFENGEVYEPVGPVRLYNSTVTDNHADSDGNGSGNGGGIATNAGPGFTLRNTILAGNGDDGGEARDCDAVIASEGNNLVESLSGCTLSGDLGGNVVGVSADLGPLADNGGPTRTHALLAGSPAIDAGNAAIPGTGGATCTIVDQRGVTRPQPGACDIGAYEVDANLCATPAAGCVQASSGKARLRLDRPVDGPGRLKWKWKGGPVAKPDFGTPVTTTGYVLCLFDTTAGTPTAVLRAIVPGGSCGRGPCWQEADTGFKYKNRAATPNGVQLLRLKAKPDDRASIGARGQGAHLALPPLPLAQDPAVVLQLQRTDGAPCWEARFSTNVANGSKRFKASSD